MKSSSSAPVKLPGITSRLLYARSGAEFPISRQSSTHATAAFRSSGWDSVLASISIRSEEHTSELQSHLNLVCRLLLEKKKPYPRSNSVLRLQLIERTS